MQIAVSYDLRNAMLMADAVRKMGAGQVRQIGVYALNQIGGKMNTQVKRQTVKQLGVSYAQAGGGWDVMQANMGDLSFKITGSGKYMGVGEFGARQFSYGVRARPWGKARVFPRAFIQGGAVLARLGPERYPIKALWAGSIPREMERTDGDSIVPEIAKEFMEVEMPKRLDDKLRQFMPF